MNKTISSFYEECMTDMLEVKLERQMFVGKRAFRGWLLIWFEEEKNWKKNFDFHFESNFVVSDRLLLPINFQGKSLKTFSINFVPFSALKQTRQKVIVILTFELRFYWRIHLYKVHFSQPAKSGSLPRVEKWTKKIQILI